MGLKIKDVEVSSLSPMMQHYVKTKNENKDCILFYRLGDFYEMFFEDAEAVSKELELTLTGKDCGLKERAPMCGVPFHAADTYINRLVERGYKLLSVTGRRSENGKRHGKKRSCPCRNTRNKFKYTGFG